MCRIGHREGTQEKQKDRQLEELLLDAIQIREKRHEKIELINVSNKLLKNKYREASTEGRLSRKRTKESKNSEKASR